MIVNGVVVKGFGVASGRAVNSPYPQGTIKMQQPFFADLGLDLTGFKLATINIEFTTPIEIQHWDHQFYDVHWLKDDRFEHFFFKHCVIEFQNKNYQALLYQPDKSSKIAHHQADTILEFIAEPISNLSYGDELVVKFTNR